MAEEALTNNKADYSEFADNELIKKNPKLTPTQAVVGALKVVRALSQGAKISPELVKAQTGIVLRQRENEEKYYNYGNQLNSSWGYTYIVNLKESTSSVDRAYFFPMALFSFKFLPRNYDASKPYDTTSMCEIDLATIHATIQELGFTFEYEEHAGYWQLVFKNTDYYIEVAYIGGDKKNQDCMISLTIGERGIHK